MGANILVIDDEPAIRCTIAFVLRKAGHQVGEARDGEEALALILAAQEQGKDFDLLLIDLQMPVMSGIELIHELKKNQVPSPIIVVSGFQDDAVIDGLLNNGCAEFIAKPFDFRELTTRVALVLGESRNKRRRKMNRQDVGERWPHSARSVPEGEISMESLLRRTLL